MLNASLERSRQLFNVFRLKPNVAMYEYPNWHRRPPRTCARQVTGKLLHVCPCVPLRDLPEVVHSRRQWINWTTPFGFMSFRRRWRNRAALNCPAAEQALCDAEFQSSLYRFRVIRARSIRHPRSPHVRFAPKADKRVDVSGHDRGADVSSPVISNYEVMILLC